MMFECGSCGTSIHYGSWTLNMYGLGAIRYCATCTARYSNVMLEHLTRLRRNLPSELELSAKDPDARGIKLRD